MDERSDQILEHIETQRDELGANLHELENRVRRSTDWRVQFDKNPMMMLGAALGGGLLLGAIVSGTRSRRVGDSQASPRHLSSSSGGPRPTGPATAHQKQQASQTVDAIKAALIAFGIARAKEFLTQALPGFDHHLNDAEQNTRRSFSSSQESGYYSRGSEYGGGLGSGNYGVGSTGGYTQHTSGSGQGANYGAPGSGSHSAYSPPMREQQERDRMPNSGR